MPAALIADARARQRAQAAEALGVDGRRRGSARLLRPADVGRRALRERRARHARPHGRRRRARSSAGGSSPAARAPRAPCRYWAGARCGISPRCSCPASAGTASTMCCCFDDRVIELQFPSPYLNNQQTDLRVRRSQGLRLDTVHVQAGYEEAFVRELEGFWASAVRGRAGAKHGRGRDPRRPASDRRGPLCDRGDGRVVSGHMHSAQRARALDRLASPGRRDRRRRGRPPRLAAGGARQARPRAGRRRRHRAQAARRRGARAGRDPDPARRRATRPPRRSPPACCRARRRSSSRSRRWATATSPRSR